MGMFDFLKKTKADKSVNNLELYSEEDLEIVETFIKENFGRYENIIHEIVSDIVHIDIAVIEPNPVKDYYTLVTIGAGAKKMRNIDAYNRVEIMIHLPKSWDIHSNEEKWYWPIRLLKSLSRLPFKNDTWIGVEHTIQYSDNFFVDTNFSGVILTPAFDPNKEYKTVSLKNDSKVHFLQVLPITLEEMQFKIENNCAELLIDSIPHDNYDFIVNVNRDMVVEELKNKLANNITQGAK